MKLNESWTQEELAKGIENAKHMTEFFKKKYVGDRVDYHSIVGGPITSRGHVITAVCLYPNNYGIDVAWITGKRGCVALESLSHSEDSINE